MKTETSSGSNGNPTNLLENILRDVAVGQSSPYKFSEPIDVSWL